MIPCCSCAALLALQASMPASCAAPCVPLILHMMYLLMALGCMIPPSTERHGTIGVPWIMLISNTLTWVCQVALAMSASANLQQQRGAMCQAIVLLRWGGCSCICLIVPQVVLVCTIGRAGGLGLCCTTHVCLARYPLQLLSHAWGE